MATKTEPAVPVAIPVYSGPPIVTAERSAIASPIGWSAIFAGAAVAVGVWLVLHMLGIGIGLTAINPEDAGTLRGVGIGTGVWSAIAPLIALFIGGLVAGRMAPTINSANAAIHGAVVWALTGLAAVVLTAMAVSSAVQGVASTGAAVGRGTAAAVGAIPNIEPGDLGLGSQDLIAPINERLQAQGLPPVTADQLEAVGRDALRSAVRRGQIDRQVLVQSIARNTRMSRADAEQVASRIEQRVDELRGRAAELGAQAQQTALQAAETTGKVLLGLSILMILGLGASVAGSVASVRRERREHVVLPRAQTAPRSESASASASAS